MRASNIHDLVGAIIAGRSFYNSKVFFTKLQEEIVRFRCEKLLVIISWNSLDTMNPKIHIEEVAEIGRPSVRYKIDENGKLDALLNFCASRENWIKVRDITSGSKLSIQHEKIVEMIVFCWINYDRLCSLEVNLKEMKTLSVLTDALMFLQRIRIDNVIEIVKIAYDSGIVGKIRQGIEEIDRDKTTRKLLDRMKIGYRDDIQDYMKEYDRICIYNPLMALKVIELPLGCGYADLFDKIYVIEPVFILNRLKEDAGWSILYRNTREDIKKEEVKMRIGDNCYIAIYVPFDSKKDALICKQMMEIARSHPI
jgi:hypothetical protein